ncbi:hypothetical protein, partial [Allorhizocola rhizosphaerae]|uniref:hypothetical protein n=1 Tax=Allorhizocola rhizosphaerae TaxID=1872709 RepID=UPI0013C2CA0E
MRRTGILLIFILWITGAGVPSDPHEDKKRVDAELAQTGALLEAVSGQVQQAITRLAEINRELPLARERAAQARGTVAAAETAVVSRQAQAGVARAEWERAAKRYDEA